MDEPFTFSVDSISTITFVVYGSCLKDSACDCFLGFGDNETYFTMSYSMDGEVKNYDGDSDYQPIAIYPTPGNVMASGDILSLLDDIDTSSVSNYWTDLRDLLAGGAGENFHDLTEEHDSSWPITVTVTNDVFANSTYITAGNGERSVDVSFDGTFKSDALLSFAFTNDVQKNGGETEGFEIYNIEVTQMDGMLLFVNVEGV